MFLTLSAIIIRIFSNSYINVFQKLLTSIGTKSSSINFCTYLGLVVLSAFWGLNLIDLLNNEIIFNTLVMGILGALGNYYIIKALSLGELSTLASINSYKPIFALIIGFLYLGEIPSIYTNIGILLIILGTYFISYNNNIIANKKAISFRILALIFSSAEAIFIKKIIILVGVNTSFFLWALSGFIFSLILFKLSKHQFKIINFRYHIILILLVFIMQYVTNFIFSRMQVAPALALFQLSTLLSVFLGVKIFKEKNFLQKITASIIMVIGAVIILLF